jgi:heparinase II/III-like protein
VRWYLARLSAMSPAEVAWRAGSRLHTGAAFPLHRRSAHDWTYEPWRESLTDLVRSRPDFLADAERIADGELELWGRRVRIDPEHPPWRMDPLEGTPCPRGSWRKWDHDPKPIWELHRQQHLFPLAAGAAGAGRGDWAAICAHQLVDWIEQNPRRGKLGWTSPYEVAHRLVGWVWTVPLVAPTLSDAAMARISQSFADQAAFVRSRPSRFSSANNHRLVEITGLLAAALLESRPADWSRLWDELEQQIVRQTFSDGGSREQAAGYFLYALEILWVAGVMAQSLSRPLGRVEERLASMLSWLDAVKGPGGEPPPFGDDAEDRLLRVDYFEPRRAATIAARVRALLGGQPSLTCPSRVESTRASIVLPESGYAVFRGQIRETPVRITTDIGDLGFGSIAAHGHADALSVVVDLDGNAILRDSGTGSYLPSLGREAFRATSAHNTVAIDGKSQARSLGPHLWGRRFRTTLEASALTPELDYVRASHDGYRTSRGGGVHERSVAYLKPENLLLVLDRIRATKTHTATLLWQLKPGDEPERLAGGQAAMIVAASPHADSTRLLGRYSPRYTWQAMAPRFAWSASGYDVLFATLIALGSPNVPKLSLRRDADQTVVEIGGPAALLVTESWTAATPEVVR